MGDTTTTEPIEICGVEAKPGPYGDIYRGGEGMPLWVGADLDVDGKWRAWVAVHGGGGRWWSGRAPTKEEARDDLHRRIRELAARLPEVEAS